MTSPPNRLLQERRLGAGALSLILLGQCIAAVLPLVYFRCTMVRSKWSSSIFHEPVGDGRQRDIFPIPSLDAGGLKRQHVCRAVSRRLNRRAHVAERVNRAIRSLNSLYFGKGSFGDNTATSLADMKYLGPPPDACDPGSQKALRVAASAYYEPEVGIGDVVPLQFSQLSLPSVGTAGVDLVSAVDESIRDVVVDFENRMLQDEDTWTCISRDAAHLKPYSDPSLHDRSKYLEFLRLLFDRGILSFSRHCRGRVGAFTVSKKDKIVDGVVKKRQRLVLDCRQTNLLFKPSPHTELGSLASLAELTLQPSQQLYISGADIQDCFYAVHIPETMMRYFCLEFDISSEEVRTVTGGSISDVGGPISPCINVLPMGFSWSFFLVQHIHQSAVLRSLSISEQDLFLDGRPPPHISSSGIYSMPYCDNIHSISSDKSSCNEGKQRIVSELAGQGFTIHEEEDASTLFNTLVGVVDGDSGRVGMTSRRAWDLIYAFEYVAEHVVSREVVQKLLGHAMFFSTINRGGMSVFRRFYDFVEHCKVPRRLTSQERQECLVFAGLIPLLFADLRKQWSNTLFCTDASPDGYGVCCREVERSTAESLGRWNERCRFKRLGPEEWAPRRRALGLVEGITVVGDDGEYDSIEQVGLNEDFPEVPLDVVDSSHWRTVLMGKWRQKEAITVNEGPALVLCLRRLCRSSRSRGFKHVVLVDSFSLALAVHKGRARSFDILRITQQVAALSIAGGFSVRLRWIASEHNVADVRPVAKSSRVLTGRVTEKQSRQSVRKMPWKVEKVIVRHLKPVVKKPQSNQSKSRSLKGATVSMKSPPAPRRKVGRIPALLEDNVGSRAQKGRLTVLEERSVSAEVQSQYRACYEKFENFCRVSRLGWPLKKEVDLILADFLDVMFLGNHSAAEGEKVVAATEFFNLHLKGTLFHCKRALRGWRKEKPAQSRLPLPRMIAAGMAMILCAWGKRLMSLKLMVKSRHVFETWRKHRSERSRHRSSSSQWGKTIPLVCNRGEGLPGSQARQDGSLRQLGAFEQCGARVPRTASLGKGSGAEWEGREGLSIRRCRISKELSRGWSAAGIQEFASVPKQARRCIGRLEQWRKRSSCCQGSGQVAHGPKCAKIWKGGENSKDDDRFITRTNGVLSVVSQKHREGAERDVASSPTMSQFGWQDVFRVSPQPQHFALEVFAGTARICSALQRRGLKCYPIDICLFPSHNVLDIHIEHILVHWLQSGRVNFIWFGMPCTSFSQARKHDGVGPGPLRDYDHLWGLPGLSRNDRQKVFTGNQLLRFTIRLLTLCEQFGIPYALENPYSSYAWHLPPLARFIRKFQPYVVHLDFCQFGECWKKPTTVMGNFWNVPSIARRCSGTFGKCSATSAPHVPLTGLASNGLFRTLLAQPYPQALAHLVAANVAKTITS